MTKDHIVGNQATWDAATADLADKNKQVFTVTIAPDMPGPEVFLIIRYSLN